MKKFIIALTALFAMTVSANAMSYEQAREQALFLTDKMAYELNLTEEQYEAAYEINLDYLMGVNSYDDVYGTYWTQRNLDMSYVLLDWQYSAFCAASYFYRPIYWSAGYWHFGIYARYPHRDYLYFGRPHFVVVYRGGHSWRHNGGRSWYHGRDFRPRNDHGGRHYGMQDGHRRGDYRNGFDNRPRGNSNMGVGRRDNNSRHGNAPNRNNNGANKNNNTGRRPSTGNRTDRQNTTQGAGRRQDNNGYTQGNNTRRTGSQGFGTRRDNGSGFSRGNRSTQTRESSTRTTVTRNRGTSSSRSFGSPAGRSSSSSSPSRSFSPSRSSGSSTSRSAGRVSSGSRSSGSSHSSGGRR